MHAQITNPITIRVALSKRMSSASHRVQCHPGTVLVRVAQHYHITHCHAIFFHLLHPAWCALPSSASATQHCLHAASLSCHPTSSATPFFRLSWCRLATFIFQRHSFSNNHYCRMLDVVISPFFIAFVFIVPKRVVTKHIIIASSPHPFLRAPDDTSSSESSPQSGACPLSIAVLCAALEAPPSSKLSHAWHHHLATILGPSSFTASAAKSCTACRRPGATTA